MTLADLASLGSFVSGAAVLVSLIFLYFQLRQIGVQIRLAERNQQAAIRQGRVARITELAAATLEPAAAEALFKGMRGHSDITDVQLSQFINHSVGRFNNAEDSFYQYKDGLLNAAAFEGFERSMRFAMSWPGNRAVFRLIRPYFAADFLAFMEGLLAEVPPVERDTFAQWRADSAAERAAAIGEARAHEPAL
jgi:hypothetical protein